MKTTRLEAFSDGVLAIIITIMVLEIKIPHGDNFVSLIPLGPIVLSYSVLFILVFIGITIIIYSLPPRVSQVKCFGPI